MRAKKEDIALATRLAAEIARLGRGRVRRVVMIGSRAHGGARPDSDLDLVVLVELPAGSEPWNGDHFARAGRELQALLGTQPVKPDVRVRTIDRFAEAKEVPGGVEWLAAHEGVVVYDAPVTLPPTVRASRDDVRRELVSAWVHHAIAALERFGQFAPPSGDSELARRAMERLVAAVLVNSRRVPRFDRDLDSYLRQIPRNAGGIAASLAPAIDELGTDPRGAAIRAAHEVVTYLSADPLQARLLVRASERLQRTGTAPGRAGAQ
jgi:predicted nucleotidyltransferase